MSVNYRQGAKAGYTHQPQIYGTQFVAARDREQAHHTFKEFMNHYGISHTVVTVRHSQTHDKIERFFGEVERRIEKSGSNR